MILEITRNNKKRLKNHKIHSILAVCWFLIVFVVFIVFERLKTATFGILIHPKYWNWPFGPKNKKNRSDPYWDLFFCWFGPKCGRSLIGPNQQKNRFHTFILYNTVLQTAACYCSTDYGFIKLILQVWNTIAMALISSDYALRLH